MTKEEKLSIKFRKYDYERERGECDGAILFQFIIFLHQKYYCSIKKSWIFFYEINLFIII